MNQEKYLIRKKVILDGGLKNADDLTVILPFEELAVKTSASDPVGTEKVLVTEGVLKDEISSSILNSHKQIVGEVEASTDVEAAGIISLYNSGSDITLKGTFEADGTNIYNKTKATAGDVIFFIKRAVADNFKPEEAVILKDLSMTLLSSTNADDARLATLEASDKAQDALLTSVVTEDDNNLKVSNEKAVTGHGALDYSTTVSEPDKIARRDEIASPLRDLDGRTTTNTDDIAAVKITADNADALSKTHTGDITSLQTRMTVVEGNPATTFKGAVRKWEGSEDVTAADADALTSSWDISAIKADDNEKFNLTKDDSIEIFWTVPVDRDNAAGEVIEDSVELIPDAPKKPIYNVTVHTNGSVEEVVEVFAKISSTGVITFTRTSANDGADWTQQKLVRIQQDVLALATGLVSKTELAAVETTANAAKVKADANETAIATNTAAIALKQDKIDNSLTTTTKSVVGAINEVKTLADGNVQGAKLATQIGTVKTSDGDDLSTTTEVIQTVKSNPIKDLTHLTTQDEIYNAVEEQKHYIVKTVNTEPAVFICNYKDKSEVFLTGFVTTKGSDILYPVYVNPKSGDKGVLTTLEAPINGYATKRYVDDKFSETLTLTFDDGTTTDIKVGK